MGDNDEIIKEFLVESHENLDRLDHDLVVMEREPSKELLAQIFRSTHTIKGTCGFFGFTKLQAVAHAGENLLSRLRDGKLAVTPEITSALLAMVDGIRQILAQIESTGGEGDADYSVLIETLNRLQQGEAPPPPDPHGPGGTPAPAVMAPVPAPPPPAPAPAAPPPPAPAAAAPPPPVAAAPVVPHEHKQDAPAGPAAEQTHAVDTILEAAGLHTASADTHIRVDVGLLDRLMTLIGELVLSRNQILQFVSTRDNSPLMKTTQRLNVITSELQENVMRTRMQPIGKVWNKFPRVVRDLAVTLGKKVRVEMEGENTELDKTLLEAISDPLTHAVRNAVDHGIESPDQREAVGKAAEGRLRLLAYHESGHVNIQIRDDGAGVNVSRVKEKAVRMGLLTPEQATRMADREAINIIFLPGFSTAEKVTNLSGRGVGMDVVRSNIERIGGTIDIQTETGQGTTLKIKIPLTLAIIPALVVTCGSDRFAIPQVSLLELLRLEADEVSRAIEDVNGVPVYRLRGRLLPLVYLQQELSPERIRPSGGARRATIVVLQAGDRQFGLVVDAVHDTEEIVVKPLGAQLKNLSIYAGATIMGDGKVALILDVMGVAVRAHVLTAVEDKVLAERREENAPEEEAKEALLLFRSPDQGCMALPLSKVARLEEVPRSDVERVGALEVVQYRGEILPLIRLADVIEERRHEPRHDAGGGETAPAPETFQAVVYTHRGRSVGLVVEQILDIVEEKVDAQAPGHRRGVLGSAVIQGRVTELLDLETVVRTAYPQLYEEPGGPAEEAPGA